MWWVLKWYLLTLSKLNISHCPLCSRNKPNERTTTSLRPKYKTKKERYASGSLTDRSESSIHALPPAWSGILSLVKTRSQEPSRTGNTELLMILSTRINKYCQEDSKSSDQQMRSKSHSLPLQPLSLHQWHITQHHLVRSHQSLFLGRISLTTEEK